MNIISILATQLQYSSQQIIYFRRGAGFWPNLRWFSLVRWQVRLKLYVLHVLGEHNLGHLAEKFFLHSATFLPMLLSGQTPTPSSPPPNHTYILALGLGWLPGFEAHNRRVRKEALGIPLRGLPWAAL
jgi:hypothetical protein